MTEYKESLSVKIRILAHNVKEQIKNVFAIIVIILACIFILFPIILLFVLTYKKGGMYTRTISDSAVQPFDNKQEMIIILESPFKAILRGPGRRSSDLWDVECYNIMAQQYKLFDIGDFLILESNRFKKLKKS